MRITTDQAPISKQSSVGKVLSTSWETIIDVPDYDVPVNSFAEGRQISKCAVELVSPVIVSNSGTVACEYSLQVIKAARYLDITQTQDDYGGQTSDVDGVVYGGTFDPGSGYVLSETITLSNGATISVDLIGDSGEVVEFSFVSAGNPVERPGAGYLNLTSTAEGGSGFILYVAEDSFTDDDSSFILANSHPVLVANTSQFYLNGHILLSGDRLQMKANNAANVHIFVSYTEGQAEEDQPL